MFAKSFSNTSRESGTVSTVDDCFRPDPLGLRVDDNSDEVLSLETSDKVDPLGECPGRCEVTYGLRLLDVLLGTGEYGLLPG